MTTDAADAARWALTDEDQPETLEELARHIQAVFWRDLRQARERAIGGQWSMACDHIVWKIVHLARMVGPTPWDDVGIDLVEDGTYSAILTAAGIAYAPPDMEQVAETRRKIESGFLSGRPR